MAKKRPSPAEQLPVPLELVERRIHLMRGQKVMLDSDLAELYQVPTKRLNEAVKRNLDRFPQDFMFQLNKEELENLRSQIATSNPGAGAASLRLQSAISNVGRGGRRYLPFAFTEHGVAMLSSVLSSPRAVQMNIVIIRAFVRLRQVLASHKDLARKIEQMDATQRHHSTVLVEVVKEINRLKQPRRQPRKPRIGFVTD